MRHKAGTRALTINDCMSTIMPLAQTTACLTLSRLNDAGYLAFCESDYGAAPKVEMRQGQRVTHLIPDFKSQRWTGFVGEIVEAPFLPICRSQIEVAYKFPDLRLAENMPGFHWITGYGDSTREVGFRISAARTRPRGGCSNG